MDWLDILLTGVIVLLLALFGLTRRGSKTDRIDTIVKKAEEEKKNELEKKPASDIVDELDNSDDVRRTIESGRDRLSDKLRKLLQRFGRKGVNPGHNDDSRG